MKGSKSFDSTRPRRQAGSSGSLHPGPLPQGYPFSASHRPGVGTDAAVSQSRQRLECGDLSPLSSASASQLAADSPVPRAKAPTSWRTPNAAATAKPALCIHICRVRNALNTYKTPGYSHDVPPGPRNAATGFFFLSPRRRSGERTEERGVLTESPSSPPSDGGEGVSLAAALAACGNRPT